MVELIMRLAWPFVAGAALGTFFFGVMWLTINQLDRSQAPAALLMVSFFGRLVITLAGFIYVAGRQPERLVAALAGFVAARLVMVAYFRPVAPGRRGGGGGRNTPDA